jgi:chromosome segregation ATPase
MNVVNDLVQTKLRAESALAALPSWSPDRRELRAQIDDVQTALAAMISRQSRREEDRRRALEHEKVWPLAQAAAERLRNVTRDFVNAQSLMNTAVSGAEHVESELAAVRRAEPKKSNYPSERDFADWRSALARSEKRFEKSAEARRVAIAERDRLSADLQKAKSEFAELKRREQRLRPLPPDEVQTRWGVQQIS